MTRTLKTLSPMIAAVLILCAVAASTAQATGEGKVTSAGGTYPLILSAEAHEAQKFTAFGKEVTCKTTTYTAAVPWASNSITVTPEYNVCHVPGPLGITLPATVTMSSCDFIFYHATTDLSDPTGNSWNLTTEIDCSEVDGAIEIHVYANETGHADEASICTIVVAPQTRTNGFTATNNANGTVTLRGQVTGIHANSHNSSSLCPEGSGTKTTTTFALDLPTGGMIVNGKTEGGAPNAFHIK
jgi:hypothetical protein